MISLSSGVSCTGPSLFVFNPNILVGGPAGCALASSLSKSRAGPSVLLVEAGGQNNDESERVDGKRWTTFMNETLNYGYKTTPQESCDGRELDFSRGRGLGGSSAVNFSVYAVGAEDDYEQWASLVDDKNFGWQQMQSRFKSLETFDGSINVPANKKYACPRQQDHGSQGGLTIGYAKEWDADVPLILDQLEEAGLPRNLDHNSGNPLGMSLMINSAGKGRRCTAADLLISAPDNLVILTDSPVQRLVLEGKKAVGIETNGRTCMCPMTICVNLLF